MWYKLHTHLSDQNQPTTELCYKDFVEKLYESGKYLSNHAVCDGSRHCYVGSLTMFCKLQEDVLRYFDMSKMSSQEYIKF